STTDPAKALAAMQEALTFAQLHRVTVIEALILREAAALEAVHGDTRQALAWFDSAVDRLHRAGNIASLIPALGYLISLFDRTGDAHVAATIFGSIADQPRNRLELDLPAVIDHVRATLGTEAFDERVSIGGAMGHAGVVQYARAEIEHTRSRLGGS
ncbi:MAG: adenylate/guanylate cyclase protein, partial [Ilumatobacteraceae bacterium]|nr:adenylate/guanylate cyclase protein [Ilumatobacteraceae bacterium]